MATSGKKGKKPKRVSLPLQDFLATNGDTKASSSQVTKVVSSWAQEVEEDDEYSTPQVFSLPTAPRASRAIDDVPENPPFMAHLSNLPYDIEEEDIKEFFGELTVESVRLPREDGGGRSRGFGYIEFGRRADLIAALSMPESQLRNRRIRIDISQESDNKRGGRGGGRYDNYGGETSNWRKDRNADDDGDGENRGGRRNNYGNYNRDREERGTDSAEDGGNWRANMKPKSDSPPPMRRNFDRDGGDRDRGYNKDRYGGRGSGGRYNDDRNSHRESEIPMERPKLNLLPRTLPLPEIIAPPPEKEDKKTDDIEIVRPAPTPVPAADIFGDAKPVDTSARDRLIEERLERERLERIEADKLAAEEKERERQLEKDKEKEKVVTEENNEKEIETENSADTKVEPVVDNWRRRPDNVNEDDEQPRTQSPARRRYSPDRNRGRPRRNDDRDRKFGGHYKDYDNRDFNRRDNRDFQEHRENNQRNREMNKDQRGHDNYNRGGRGGGGSGGGGGGGGDRDNRDYNRDHKNRSNQGGEEKPIRRAVASENHSSKDPLPDENSAPIEARMPKYQAPTKPKLQMSNKYEFLDDASD